MKEEAGEVVRAVGAWVLVFRKAVKEGEGEGEVVCKHFLFLFVRAGGGEATRGQG